MNNKTKPSCAEWLRKYLSKNAVLCEEVRSAAKKNGYAKTELKRARVLINIKTYHQFDDDGATPNYFWYLPEAF